MKDWILENIFLYHSMHDLFVKGGIGHDRKMDDYWRYAR